MRGKVLIALILLAAILLASVIFQIAIGLFRIGFWVGIILTIIVVGFILSKVGRKKKTDPN
jgi:hypothetical protein